MKNSKNTPIGASSSSSDYTRVKSGEPLKGFLWNCFWRTFDKMFTRLPFFYIRQQEQSLYVKTTCISALSHWMLTGARNVSNKIIWSGYCRTHRSPWRHGSVCGTPWTFDLLCHISNLCRIILWARPDQRLLYIINSYEMMQIVTILSKTTVFYRQGKTTVIPYHCRNTSVCVTVHQRSVAS